MKKFLRTVKTVVVYLIGIVALVAIIYSGFELLSRKNSVEYVAPEPIERVQEIVSPKSDVEQANEMLAEATAKLDKAEAEHLANIEALEAEIAAEEQKIAEINEIRSSF